MTTKTNALYAEAIKFRKSLKIGEIKEFNGYYIERQSSQWYRISGMFFVKGALALQETICKAKSY